MYFFVGVENFAKIEMAKVCTNSYTLLVGPNNSGKTFLMQLVQGLERQIFRLINDYIVEILQKERYTKYSKYTIDEKNIEKLISYINKKLEKKKEDIIKSIFGRNIPIERLYIDIQLQADSLYEISVIDQGEHTDKEIKEKFSKEIPHLEEVWPKDKNTWKVSILSEKKKDNSIAVPLQLSMAIAGREVDIVKNMLIRILESKSMFLPASRTGLMLLYRDFFANKTDDAIVFQMEDNKLVENKQMYGGLTQPIYDFLKLLQTYVEDEKVKEAYKKELDFFEQHIIEGHININKQGMISYQSNNTDTQVPIYLASAMINEVTPIVMALTSDKHYSRLIIDEAEASLHPQKQLELVRFLNRLSNKGVKLMISTHSDTLVSKINNLYILSASYEKKHNEEIIKKFGLENEDLLTTNTFRVYEFITQKNGKSVVNEIIPDKESGYQFDLFAKSAMSLYDEAVKLGEIQG